VSTEDDAGSPEVLAKKITELFKGDERPVTQEQLAKCMAAMLTVETIFTRLLILMTEMNKVGANPKQQADDLLEAIRNYRSHIGDILESAKPSDLRADS